MLNFNVQTTPLKSTRHQKYLLEFKPKQKSFFQKVPPLQEFILGKSANIYQLNIIHLNKSETQLTVVGKRRVIKDCKMFQIVNLSANPLELILTLKILNN